MSYQESLSVLSSAADLVSSSQAIKDSSTVETSQFADILAGVSAVETAGSSIVNISSVADTFSVDSLQQQILTETGLDNPNILSLSMNDNMIAELQDGLLSSLQSSLIKTAISQLPTEGISASTNISSDSISSLVSTSENEEGSIGEDIYNYSFGEDGFDQKDIIDSVNILNHTPILSYIYQETTDTEISPASTLAGSLLYSDYVGAGSTAIKLIMDYFTENNSDGIAADVSSFFSDDNKDSG